MLQAAMQVASRLWLLWGVIVPVKEPTVTGSLLLLDLGGGFKLELSLFTLVTAWALSEVIRYSFFMLKVRVSCLSRVEYVENIERECGEKM